MQARTITISALMVALMIALQFCLGFVPGVELVTVLFVSFCFVFGVRYSLLTATAFSLARCILFGFYPNVIILYLVYYNFVAVIFGSMSRCVKAYSIAAPVVLAAVAGFSAYFAIVGVPISAVYKTQISVMLWVLFAICLAVAALHIVLHFVLRRSKLREVSTVTSVAVFCTVLFTLLDDIISPLVLGYGMQTALTYFYTSFLAMLPQTICVAVSVLAIFYPLKKAMLLCAPDARKKLFMG